MCTTSLISTSNPRFMIASGIGLVVILRRDRLQGADRQPESAEESNDVPHQTSRDHDENGADSYAAPVLIGSVSHPGKRVRSTSAGQPPFVTYDA
jgi:hypothetical protein